MTDNELLLIEAGLLLVGMVVLAGLKFSVRRTGLNRYVKRHASRKGRWVALTPRSADSAEDDDPDAQP